MKYKKKKPLRTRPNTYKGWREIGGKKHYYKSLWEINYAKYLEFLKTHGEIIDWEYEPETFWFEGIKRGVRSYLPDFKVYENNNNEVVFHEVKGYMDAKSKTKIKRLAKYHPHIRLEIIDSKKYNKIKSKLCRVIPDWENG